MLINLFLPVTLSLLVPAGTVASQGRLVALDTVWLEQSESEYLARPTFLARMPSGFLVVDGPIPQVAYYGPDGDFRGLLGRDGEGPGESKDPRFAGAYSPGTGYVVSARPPRIHVFALNSRRLTRSIPLRTGFTTARLAGGRFVLGAPNYSTDTGVRWIDPDELIETRRAVQLPELCVDGGPACGTFGQVHVVPLGMDRLVVAFEPTNYLLLTDGTGTVLDTLHIPVEHRRGVPRDVAARIEAAARERFFDMFGVLSTVRGLEMLPTGEVVVIHYDSAPMMPPVHSQVYFSVVDVVDRKACVDIEVPVQSDGHPVVALAGDTLMVLDQIVRGFEAVPAVARFLIDSQACSWIRLDR